MLVDCSPQKALKACKLVFCHDMQWRCRHHSATSWYWKISKPDSSVDWNLIPYNFMTIKNKQTINIAVAQMIIGSIFIQKVLQK